MTADPRHDYLAAYRRSVESPSGALDANLQAVLERAGHGSGVEATPKRWAASVLVVKFATAALVTTGLGWGAVSMLTDDAPPTTARAVAPAEPDAPKAPAPRPASRSVPAAPPPAPALASSEPAQPPATARPSTPRVRTSAPTPESQGAADRLREELALLERAQKHLRAGNIAAANRALQDHARRFPQGTLSIERSAWTAIAACSGTGPQPKAAARSFVLTYKDTPLSAKVKTECSL
ncbi:MAG: hypothetical protein ACRBN8_01525 [Nannocystales bacterium]